MGDATLSVGPQDTGDAAPTDAVTKAVRKAPAKKAPATKAPIKKAPAQKAPAKLRAVPADKPGPEPRVKPEPKAKPEPKVQPAYDQWSGPFLRTLAETSNVTEAAKQARIGTAKAYETKRTNSEFNRRWRQALCDGYELLEMDLLQRMRVGQDKGGDGRTPDRAFDNSVALRLLIAHRAEAARQRAVRDNQDADAILASINAKLERMRQNRLAAAAQTVAVIGLLPAADGHAADLDGNAAEANAGSGDAIAV